MITKFFLALSLILLPCSVFSESSTVGNNSEKLVRSICQQLDDDESIETIAEALFDDCTPDEIELIKKVARLHEEGHSLTEIVSIIQQSKSEQSKSLLTTPSFWIKVAVATGVCIGLCYLLYRYFKRPPAQNNEGLLPNLQPHIVDPAVQQQNAMAEQQAQAYAIQRQQEELAEEQMLQQERAQQQAHMQQQQQAAQQHMQQQQEQARQHMQQQQQAEQADLLAQARAMEQIMAGHRRRRLVPAEEYRQNLNNFDQRIQANRDQIRNENDQFNALEQQLQRAQNDPHYQSAIEPRILLQNEMAAHNDRLGRLLDQEQALFHGRNRYQETHRDF